MLNNLRQARQTSVVLPEINALADKNLRDEMKLYNLCPSEKQFVAAATYLSVILSPVKALLHIMKQVGHLWDVAKSVTDVEGESYALQSAFD